MAREGKRNCETKAPSIVLRFAAALAIPTIGLILWDCLVRFGIVPASILPLPSKVGYSFWILLTDGTLFRNSAVSIARLVGGLALGSATGVLLAFLVGTIRPLARLLEPTLGALIPIPGVAWIPFLIITFGIGETTNVALLSIGSFCVLFMQTLQGVRHVDSGLVEVGFVLGKSRQQILIHILFPAALPSIFAGVRVALALSWTLLVASEMIASSSGLGWLIWNSRNFSRSDDMIAAMIAVACLGRATEVILTEIERRALRWKVSYHELHERT